MTAGNGLTQGTCGSNTLGAPGNCLSNNYCNVCLAGTNEGCSGGLPTCDADSATLLTQTVFSGTTTAVCV